MMYMFDERSEVRIPDESPLKTLENTAFSRVFYFSSTHFSTHVSFLTSQDTIAGIVDGAGSLMLEYSYGAWGIAAAGFDAAGGEIQRLI